MLEGIYLLMRSDIGVPVNIGCPQYVSVKELIDTVTKVAGKKVRVKWIAGPVGVQSRNFSNEKIYSLGWKSRFSLKDGIALTYPWVAEQVRKAR
jgi:nucleoside-diphosphate-sugar epimerase